MKIEFELNDKQTEVLKQLLELPQNKGKTEGEACKIVVVQALINARQQMVAQELSN